jgi:hypothetical protein
MESKKHERESGEEDAIMKRFRTIAALGSSVKTVDRSSIAIPKKKGVQLKVMIKEPVSLYNSKYIRIACVVIENVECPNTDSFPVHGQFSSMEPYIPGFDKSKTRPPIMVDKGSVLDIVSFQDGAAIAKKLTPGVEVFVSGLNFSVSHYLTNKSSSGYDDEDKATNGDASIEWVAGSITPVKQLSIDEIGQILSLTKIGRVEELPGGVKIPYPPGLEHVDVKYTKNKKDVIANGIMVHWGLSNELLLSRARAYPTVFFHLDNSYHYLIHHDDTPQPNPGPVLVLSAICDSSDLVWKNKDGVEVFGFAGPKENFDGLRLMIADFKLPPADFFGRIQMNDINSYFGLYDSNIWKRCAQQLLRGLDCFIQLKADRQKSQCVETSDAYLLRGFMNFVCVNYSKTFKWSGLRVPMKLAVEILARNTYEEKYNGQQDINTLDVGFQPSPVSVELISDPTNQSIRCLCLNEFKGDVTKILNDDNWDFYVVPPSDFHQKIKEARQYHEKELLFTKNTWEEKDRIQEVYEKYCKDDDKRLKLTVFAHRI